MPSTPHITPPSDGNRCGGFLLPNIQINQSIYNLPPSRRRNSSSSSVGRFYFFFLRLVEPCNAPTSSLFTSILPVSGFCTPLQYPCTSRGFTCVPVRFCAFLGLSNKSIVSGHFSPREEGSEACGVFLVCEGFAVVRLGGVLPSPVLTSVADWRTSAAMNERKASETLTPLDLQSPSKAPLNLWVL